MMEQEYPISNDLTLIPLIVDVERNIDGYNMVRCSYYSIQSDEPLPVKNFRLNRFKSPILILNLEAILVGPPNGINYFNHQNDIDAMYNFVEEYPALFVDINDIWIPTEWFGNILVKQGMVFRLSQKRFSLCWKLRNDKISTHELFEEENVKTKSIKQRFEKEPAIIYSKLETKIFNQWTLRQIEQSRKRYKRNKKRTLKKIKE